MDLALAGRSAIVCGSSKGLGRACALALAQAGVAVTLNGRDAGSLSKTASEFAAILGKAVTYVAADVTTDAGRAQLLAASPAPDILVNNSAGPPPGRFEDWGEPEWAAALNANMLTPIFLINAVLPAMRKRRWGRIINITSGAVKAPLPMLGLSNGARGGLTGFIAGIAREVARDGVTINNMLPGQFETDRLTSYASKLAATRGVSPAAVLDEMKAHNPTGRVGRPDEFGAMCAFLASEHAGFITGQNILLDGGAYPGVM